jgi:hypothetical protein
MDTHLKEHYTHLSLPPKGQGASLQFACEQMNHDVCTSFDVHIGNSQVGKAEASKTLHGTRR